MVSTSDFGPAGGRSSPPSRWSSSSTQVEAASDAAADQGGEDHLGAGADHVVGALEVHDQALEVRVVLGAHPRDRVGFAGDAPRFHNLWVLGERLRNLIEQRA